MPDLRDADVDVSLYLPPEEANVDYEARVQEVREAVNQPGGPVDLPAFEGGELHQPHINTDDHPLQLKAIVSNIAGINGFYAVIQVNIEEPQLLQELQQQVEEAVDEPAAE